MSGNCEIFISAKTLDGFGNPTRDSQLAHAVYDYLTTRGHTVFLSTLSLAKLGVDAYKKAIDDALDAARILIAVGTSPENLESQWVRYEWDSFFNDVLSGVKPDGHIFVYVEGMSITLLPRALRQRQVFIHGPGTLAQLGNFVHNALAERVSVATRAPYSLTKREAVNEVQKLTVNVVAVGCAHVTDLASALDCANSCQSLFEYVLLDDALADAVRLVTYRAIYAPDFFDNVENVRGRSTRERFWLIVVAGASVSGDKLANLFGAHRAHQGLALITTHQVPEVIIPSDRMAAYFLYYLARYTLSFLFPDLQNHEDTRSCVFDRKIRKSDLRQSMAAAALCDECRRRLLAAGGLDAADKIAALDRLFALSGEILTNGFRQPHRQASTGPTHAAPPALDNDLS